MEKIAVIGISTLFPGSRTPGEYWQNLINGKDLRSEAGMEQMGVPPLSYYDHRKGTTDRYYCLSGGYIRDFELEPTGFSLSPGFIQGLDDIFKWSLYTAREALLDAGYLGSREVLGNCGVVMGNLSFPTKRSNHLFLPLYKAAVEKGLSKALRNEGLRIPPFSEPLSVPFENTLISGFPSALTATALDLGGPSLCLDAACASSVYSVKLACDYLNSGKADMMLAGAVSGGDPFFINMGFSIFQAYPEKGGSAPMDRNSGGLYAGEGAGMFVLKRYADALREGDRIHAVIRGVGLSNDGRGQSVLSPGSKGQMKAFERAYEDSATSPTDVAYVECHATGTPLGDKVELDSMEDFFGKKGASPLVGSAKSNLGHLLTAAGMAGMTKVILAMKERKIPPTINVTAPLTEGNKAITEKNIPASVLPWPDKGSPALGAVSGFGFGGTNGHIILSEPPDEDRRKAGGPKTPEGPGKARKAWKAKTTPPSPTFPLAVVGMDCLFGPLDDLHAFKHSVMEGERSMIPLPRERWLGMEKQEALLREHGLKSGGAPEGAYVESFDIDFLKFKVPPREDDALIPQQLIAMRTADNALRRSGIEKGAHVAVIVAMGTELSLHRFRGRVNLATQLEGVLPSSLSEEARKALLNAAKDSVHPEAQVNQYTSFIGNIMASRIASLWDFSGPAFSVSSEENSVARAIEVAGMLLSETGVEAVVVGAVDLAGSFENVLVRSRENPLNTGDGAFGFDRSVNGWSVGEGSGAVVLKRPAQTKGNRVHALIESLEFTRGISGESVAGAAEKAMAAAGISPSSIGYVEAHGSGVEEEDRAEIEGLTRAYKPAGEKPACALGSAKANVGHLFSASGMASLIKAILCLDNAAIPGTPGWNGPKHEALFSGSPFYVPESSVPWFSPEQGEKRYAGVSSLGRDRACAHMILSSSSAPPVISSRSRGKTAAYDYLSRTPFTLIPLCGDTRESLLRELANLRSRLESGTSPAKAAADAHARYIENPGKKYRIAVTGTDKSDISGEILLAQKGVETAFATSREWVSPSGSCFTPSPLGKRGKVAFVYPGGFNAYPGAGRELFQLFPDLLHGIYGYTSAPGEIIANPLFYPRSLEAQTETMRRADADRLLDAPAAMFEYGVTFAVLLTAVLREHFRVVPQMAMGYSMGEVSMMYALGVWKNSDGMRKSLNDSDLFATRLCGPMETVRRAWGLPAAASTETGNREKIWFAHTLACSPDAAKKAIAKEERAYLLFVNTPGEVVIAGDKEACQRVVAELGCPAVSLPLSDVIHCDPVKHDYRDLVELHRCPVERVGGIDFYSSATLSPLDLDSDAVAKNIADVYSATVDFTKLVMETRDKGAGIFIELGPRDNCTGWIGEILADREHLAVGIDRKGVGVKRSLVKLLARLYCHGVPMDLSPLYPENETSEAPKRSLVRPIGTGGNDMGSITISHKLREALHGQSAGKAQQPSREKPPWAASRVSAKFHAQSPPHRTNSSKTKSAPLPDSYRTDAPAPGASPDIAASPASRSGGGNRTTGLSAQPFGGSHAEEPRSKGGNTTARSAARQFGANHAEAPRSVGRNTTAGLSVQQPGGNHAGASTAPGDFNDNARNNGKGLKNNKDKGSSGIIMDNGSRFADSENRQPPAGESIFDRNLSDISSVHRTFLENRSGALREMGELIRLQMEIASGNAGSAGVQADDTVSGNTHRDPGSSPAGEHFSPEGAPGSGADAMADTLQSPHGSTVDAVIPSAQTGIVQGNVSNENIAGISINDAPHTPDTFNRGASPGVIQGNPPSRPTRTGGTAETTGHGNAYALKPGEAGKAGPSGTPPRDGHEATHGQGEVIWDKADLLEFAEGDIEKVFGPAYAVIDTYRRRVRLPMEDYLLVSRVTKLDAVRGELKPSTMTTEYDIPREAPYTIDGQIPWAVAVESGQCDLLLISYLGVDFTSKGDRVYRLLDCTLTFMDHIAMEGDTLRYDISINSFAKNGESLLFFFSYNCWVGDKLVLKMRNGCAGFFTDEELAAGKGIIDGSDSGDGTAKKKFSPILRCEKSAFDKNDLLHIVNGNPGACFGLSHDQGGLNPSLRFATGRMLMLDRIISTETSGGRWGLGKIVAEKDLAPDHWYFPCHFKDDQVMAGSLMSEGCGQLLQFYLLHMGLQTKTVDARFQPIEELPQKVRCRGQVTPRETLLTYVLHVKEVGVDPFPHAVADIDILCDGKIVVDFKDLGVRIVEKRKDDPMPARALHSPKTAGRANSVPVRAAVGNAHAADRPLGGTRENRASAVHGRQSADAPEAGENTGVLFDRHHLTAFATGSLADCFGPSYGIYENRQPPRTPNGNLQLISRVLSVTGKKGDFKNPAEVVSEYDVPADAWFFTDNNHPGVMPYSVLMEIALQPCGFISTWAETTLIAPEVDFFFRNLDGEGKLLAQPDTRGKTITNRSVLITTVATGNTIIQKFTFELSVDGTPFYEGTAAFGYFVKAALTHQLGLDGGVDNHPLTEKKYLEGENERSVDLKSMGAINGLYAPAQNRPFYRLAAGRLDFIDSVRLVPSGGKYGKGYIYAQKKIDPSDWFYPCHFHNDPVMPGSLGVEAILQAIQVFALDQDLGKGFSSPCFTRPETAVAWKYRGQIIPANNQMSLEIHIKDIVNTPGRTTITGDAGLWKETIRIYEVTDIALCMIES